MGRRIGAWPDNRSDMPWGGRAVAPGAGLPRDEAMRAWYQRLIAVRRAHPALSRGAHRTLSSEGDLLVYLRADDASGDAALVAVNRGDAAAEATVPRPAAWTGRPVQDLLQGAGAEARPSDDAATLLLRVAPRSVAVFGAR